MLSPDERNMVRTVGAELLTVDGELDDFGDEVIAALASHRILLCAVLRTILTAEQHARIIATADELVRALRVKNAAPDVQEKIRRKVSTNISICRAAAAPARG